MKHKDWERLEALMPSVRAFQSLARAHGIADIFQDNGGKILQMLLALNLQGIPGREGNDAVDMEGREYELKSVNIWLTDSFSTNHHINKTIIDKYRDVQWVFAIYEGIEMRRAYSMAPAQLEVYFAGWEAKWLGNRRDINNPKIPRAFVVETGKLIYTDERPIDFATAAAIRREKRKASTNRRAAKKAAQIELIKDRHGDK